MRRLATGGGMASISVGSQLPDIDPMSALIAMSTGNSGFLQRGFLIRLPLPKRSPGHVHLTETRR